MAFVFMTAMEKLTLSGELLLSGQACSFKVLLARNLPEKG
jgi:hypothetical protein